MKSRVTAHKKGRVLPYTVSGSEELNLPRLYLFLELFVGNIPDVSTK